MFDFLKVIFDTVVYLPQLNLLYLLTNITKDIGISIAILAIVVNLLLWPVIVQSYLSGQKMRILGPKIREIQSRFKRNPNDTPTEAMDKVKAMQAEIKGFYTKHKIKTGVFFQVVFLQLFFASGVFYVVNNVSKSGGGAVSGIYENIFGVSSAVFPQVSLNFLNIGTSSVNYIFLPLSSFILSYLYGKYSFHWAPNTKLPQIESVKDSTDNELGIDPASIQKNQEFMIIYVLPFITLIFNASFSAGLNLYFAILSLFNLIRHIITQYYSNHVSKLFEDMAESDPSLEEIKSEISSEAVEVDFVPFNNTTILEKEEQVKLAGEK
jgi:YidC/Oxa1 family membrane protein insertase